MRQKLKSALHRFIARAPVVESLSAEVAQLQARMAELGAKTNQLSALVAVLPGGLTAPLRGDYYRRPDRPTATEYWRTHNVSAHREFQSAQQSLDYFNYRNSLYIGYGELMSVSDMDGKVVLDFGCGPGNDLVGFSHYSRPSRLVGVDISDVSLEEAKKRLVLHGMTADLIKVPYGMYAVPLEDASVDYIHCSGVLMLIEDPVQLLREFRRILKSDGQVKLVVYNYDSLWLHLYVAYVVQVYHGLYADVDVLDAFSRTTDGEDCPLVQVWRPSEMQVMADASGFVSEFLGAALSLWELHTFPLRFWAAMDHRLRRESRDFLLAVTLDERGYPLYRGRHAGIDGCYRFRPCR